METCVGFFFCEVSLQRNLLKKRDTRWGSQTLKNPVQILLKQATVEETEYKNRFTHVTLAVKRVYKTTSAQFVSTTTCVLSLHIKFGLTDTHLRTLEFSAGRASFSPENDKVTWHGSGSSLEKWSTQHDGEQWWHNFPYMKSCAWIKFVDTTIVKLIYTCVSQSSSGYVHTWCKAPSERHSQTSAAWKSPHCPLWGCCHWACKDTLLVTNLSSGRSPI